MGKKKSKTIELEIDSFPGIVLAQGWKYAPHGDSCSGWLGIVSIIPASDIGEGKMTSKDANWIVRIASANGKRSVNVLGCQVSSIAQFESIQAARDGVTVGRNIYDVELAE